MSAAQRFYANPATRFVWTNGAIGLAPGGTMDCLGHFAKVHNCPIDGLPDNVRYTCYATGYADTYFSVPACTRIKSRYISGFFITTDDAKGVIFVPMAKHKAFIAQIGEAHASRQQAA